MSVTAAPPLHPPLPQGCPTEPVLLRFGDQWKLTLLHFDLAIITLWFIVTTVQFKSDELLLYPMALYFTYAFFRDWNLTWPVLKRAFILLLLPTWWLASTLWSPESAQAFRSGVQMILTMLICMFIASRLTVNQLLTIALIAISVAALRSLPSGLTDMSLGRPSKAIYPHKNSLGLDMSILWVTALALVLIPETPRIVRRAAICMLPIALLLVFASKSATAILLSLGMAGILIGSLAYLGRTNVITYGRLASIAFTIGILAAALGLILNFFPFNPVDAVLGAVGKDRTLTGRTGLWEIAMREVQERPLLGTGAKGYWRYFESADIRQIYYDYYKNRKNLFHFHNSWLEIAVNLGMIGVLMAFLGMGWALSVLVRVAVTSGGPQNWALLAIAAAILVRTMAEADLFAQFVMLYMLLWTAAMIVSGPAPPDPRSSRQ